MGLNRTFYIVALWALPVLTASAQLIAVERFNYPSGAALHGQAGGIGFAGNWDETGLISDRDVIEAQHLPYSTFANPGRSLRSRAPATFSTDLSRPMTPIPGTNGTAIWASFLVRKNSEGSSAPLNYFGLVLYPAAANAAALFIGDTGETDVYSLGIAGSAQGQVGSAVASAVSPSATLLVVKITFQTGADIIQLFVNPNPLGTDPVQPAATKTDLDVADVSALGILAGNDAEWTADEILIGRRFVDVVPRSLRVISAAKANGTAQLRTSGLAFETHTIQYSNDLKQAFTFLGVATADADGTVIFNDTSASTTSRRFYRLVYP